MTSLVSYAVSGRAGAGPEVLALPDVAQAIPTLPVLHDMGTPSEVFANPKQRPISASRGQWVPTGVIHCQLFKTANNIKN